ncbi:hypothetical protein P167DRAFT_548889 [Morchella conica CCBAS932]|uniref:Uncharacterized protein n=1 Tax=Morchella conica CCBAS932 TaxID=1392247 RepID=A0A3N4KDD3_9PEZI|nr:hypothetical protein P167DRAFT_548889 [Morchella conica CCBAS932]
MPSDSGAASSSVSPKVIVPSVTVIALLVLITFIGAVIIFVRAYKKRRRNQAGTEKQDEEAANAAATADTKTGKHRRSGASSSFGGGSGERGGGRDAEDVISPVPRAAHSHQEARDIVEQGFRRSRRSGDGVERGVVFGQGYSVWNGPGQQQQDEGAAPVIGKIERIMGNPLSNDFYTDRASGSGHSRNNSAAKAAAKEKKRESKRHSYPVVNTKNAPLRTSSARPTTALELDTNLSPVSPDETELSTARDFSPYSGDNGIFKSLSPPPAAPAAIALRYPNVTALVRANIPGESASKRSSFRSSHRTSSRFSYTQLHDGTNLSDHISSQYSRSKKEQKSPSPIHIEKVNTPDPLPSPPAWAAFGGFDTSRNSKSSSSQPSRISTLSSGTDKSAEQSVKSHGHGHRLSWNGRSVLDLDPAPPPVPSKHSPTPPPIAPSSPTPSSPSRPLRRKDRNIPIEPTSPPKFATAPRVRTSAFGPSRQKNYPQLPPIPPDPEDVASGQLFLPTLMSRSGSNSKMSVLSVPSTISSLNTINTITRSTTGLSPTPARQYTPRNTPEPLAVAPDASSRKSIGASTILTETSETSNMTAAELELEMRKIRDRAKRASEERRGSRVRYEQSWLAEEEAESSIPGQGVGHRFF